MHDMVTKNDPRGADPSIEMPQLGAEGKVFNDRAPSVFGSNYPRLQQIKKKYDPEMLFSKWFVITPA
jgi:FAD/FMN-containing dehydrogenase